MRILHHDSRKRYFNNFTDANYSLEKDCFSILREIDERFKIDSENYSFLLEYPQVPKYLSFRQKEYFTTKNSKPIGYKRISSNGSWPFFGGIHILRWEALYVGQDNGENWHYPIGTISKEYAPYVPVVYEEAISITDLWVEIWDFSLLKYVKAIYSIYSKKNAYKNFLSFLFLISHILISE